MLHEVWGRQKRGSRFIVGIRDGVVKHYPVGGVDETEALVQRLDSDKWDVYYAPASFDGDRRLADNAITAPGLWADLDCGPGKQYENEQEALAGLLSWSKQHRLPAPTHVVHSGYGLHVYWLFDAPVPIDDWRDAASRFRRALAVSKVVDDPGVSGDAARILRVPGTHNHKGGKCKPVRLLHRAEHRVRLDDLLDKLPSLGPQRTVRPDDEWAVDVPMPPGDAEKIAEGCAQIRHMRDTRGNAMPEPLWRAGLSVLWRCDDRDKWIHEWSKGDPRYSPQQTQNKASATAGPATCAHFAELNPDTCRGCPFAGRVTSPIQIAVSVTAAPAIAEGPDDWRRAHVGQFLVSSGGVWLHTEGEKPKPTLRVPLWIVEVRERAKRQAQESDASSLLFEWVAIDGTTKRAVALQEEVYSTDALKRWAARENLASAVVDWKRFVRYISEYTLESIKELGVRKYHETLGWCEGGFVLGDRMVTADGVDEVEVQTSNQIQNLRGTEGNLDGWLRGLSRLDSPQYSLHQFAVQAGFGSALLTPADRRSAVVSLVGPPGTGKTLMADVALSIYGNPEHLRQGADSSPKASERQLSCNRDVPYLIDEITQWRADRAGRFCYMAANGQGGAKLTSSRTDHDTGFWRLVPYVTSNRPLLEYPTHLFTEAHRARLIELSLDVPMPREDGVAVHDLCVVDNAGHAAVPFLEWAVRNKEAIPDLVDQAEKQILSRYAIADSHRFALWTLAVTLVAGAAAKSLGLIPWDPVAAVYAAANEVAAQSLALSATDEAARDVISEWLTEHNEHIVYWDKDSKLGSTLVRDPIARSLGDGTIAIHRQRLQEHLVEKNISRKAAASVISAPALLREARLMLAPGTAPVWVYVIRNEAVDFEP